MRIDEAPVVDVRGPLTAQRERLLRLLDSLSPDQWAAPTVAPHWSVKDIALHLLGVDLSWLARHRDRDQSGIIPVPPGHEEFVRTLAQHNQRWVDGARALSPQLITGLLRWSGEQLDAYLATVDLMRPSSVYWAGQAPLWFDLAREFTERWVHYRQIEEAARPGLPKQGQDEYLPLVLRTFVWGFPHQYRAPAPAGTAIAVDIPGIGGWTLTRTATGWSLDEGNAAGPAADGGHAGPAADEGHARPAADGGHAAPAASLRISGEAAWRLLTGAPYDPGQVQLSGDPALAEPLLQVRGIIV